MTKLWGGRFTEDPNELAYQFNASLPFDQRLWAQDIRGSRAWARALAAAGVIKAAEVDQITGGLALVNAEFQIGSFKFQPSDEDIHTAVERRLGELIGPTAGKLHTGRSRNDQVVTDFRLWVMESEEKVIAHVRRLESALVVQAEAHVGTLMPGYTHTQRAQPVTFGHWLMGHVWALERDVDRWQAARSRASVCPLGSGALSGTSYAIDRGALAQALGFARVSENSLDAVADRDFAVEFLFNAALLGSHLSRMADSLILFSSAEFGFVTLADAYASGSSLMPQKKNPDVLELSRGKAGTLLGHLTGLMATLKGLPSAYDKDLQEDKAPVMAAFDTLTVMLPVVTGAVATLTVNAGRMQAALDSSLLATELADYLVRKGVAFREAHHIVGEAVRLGPLDKLSLAQLRALSPAFEADVTEVWDFRAAVNRRAVWGGTSEANVRGQIAEARKRLEGIA
jgi:argininosuccinate lyase